MHVAESAISNVLLTDYADQKVMKSFYYILRSSLRMSLKPNCMFTTTLIPSLQPHSKGKTKAAGIYSFLVNKKE